MRWQVWALPGFDSNGVSNLTGGVGVFGVDSAATASQRPYALLPIALAPVLSVTHDFKPSASAFLYQVDVTIRNLSGADLGSGPNDLRYTRLMA